MDHDFLFNAITKSLPSLVWSGACLSATKIRESLAPDADDDVATLKVAREYKWSCFLKHILNVFGGSMLANLLLGQTPYVPLLASSHFLLAIVVWFLIIYCPRDYFYKAQRGSGLISLYLEVSNMIWRGYKIYVGVQQAMAYPLVANGVTCIIHCAVIGLIRGTGPEMIDRMQSFITNQVPRLHVAEVKMSFFAAVLFAVPCTLGYSYDYIIFNIVMTLLVAVKVTRVIKGEESCTEVLRYAVISALVIVDIVTCVRGLKYILQDVTLNKNQNQIAPIHFF